VTGIAIRRKAAAFGAALCACLAACGGDSPGPTGPSATLNSVAIDGLPAGILQVGQTVQARAMGTYSDGSTREVQASWSSSNTSILTVSPTGMVAAVATGAAEISASVSGVTGRRSQTVASAADSENEFRVAIMVTATTAPAASDVTRVLARAAEILFQKTGERLRDLGFASGSSGDPTSQANRYLATLPNPMPDGVLALADDANAISFGGYSTTTPLPGSFVNRFPSPNFFGATRAYVAVVDFVHKYARCGYDDAGNRISDRSAGGECRNQSGLLCANNGRYWQCPDTFSDLYSQPDVFPACTIVHEFMHPFGPAGNADHYGTATCTGRTGMSPVDAVDRRKFQESCGMCPDVYQNFRRR
jgi:Bacterial Ig-like domain (group 2)